jgi:hypothetical protein
MSSAEIDSRTGGGIGVAVAVLLVAVLAGGVWLLGRLASPDVVAVAPSATAGSALDRNHDHDGHLHDAGGHRHVTELDDDARFTGPGDVWPPQPKGAVDIVERSLASIQPTGPEARLAELDRAGGTRSLGPSAVLAADESVSEALGRNYNLVAVDQVGGAVHLIWYSLSNNVTVEAVIDGGLVAALEVHPPTVYQPELSDVEKLAAADVARAYWVTAGDARIGRLQGFSILAFQPDGSYYDTRMVYVSFHVDADSRPELVAWVDLAAATVIKAEVDR